MGQGGKDARKSKITFICYCYKELKKGDASWHTQKAGEKHSISTVYY
jgi:hypothetical protein